MRRIELRVAHPPCSWCRVATAVPNVQIRIESCLPMTPGSMIETASLQGSGWRDAVEKIEAAGVRLDVLDENEEGARIRLIVPSCALLDAAAVSGVHPAFPFDLSEGFDTWHVTGPAPEVRTFVGHLRERGMSVEVAAIQPHVQIAGLTLRQRAILEASLKAGYYAYPRRITLTRLARRIGIAKSTLSEALVKLESEMIGERASTHPRTYCRDLTRGRKRV